MNDSPRFLQRHRLEQLARGLKVRLGQGTQKIAQQLEELRARMLDLQVAAEERSASEHSRFQQQQTAAINDWDQQRMAVWDDAERRAFKSADGARTQENRLRVDARRQGEELTNEAKKRIADVERRFMRSKDKTIAKLAKVKEQIEQIAGGLAVVQQEAVTLLAQRGMTLNVDTASRSFTDGPPAKAADAIERCHARIQHARELLHWMAHNRITRSIESVASAAVRGLRRSHHRGQWLDKCFVVVDGSRCWLHHGGRYGHRIDRRRSSLDSSLDSRGATQAGSHAGRSSRAAARGDSPGTDRKRCGAAKISGQTRHTHARCSDLARQRGQRTERKSQARDDAVAESAAAERVAVKEQLNQSLRAIEYSWCSAPSRKRSCLQRSAIATSQPTGR